MIEKMSTDPFKDYYDNCCDIFDPKILHGSEMTRLGKNTIKVDFRKGDIIFKQDTPTSDILYLESGLIKIVKENNHTSRHLLRVIKPRNFVGYTTSFCDKKYDFSASAVMDSTVYFINKRYFLNLMKNNPQVNQVVMTHMCKTVLFMKRMVCISNKQLPGKTADVLLQFCESIYCREEFKLPLTRQELGEMVGASRESVGTALKNFEKDGIISMKGSIITILDKPKLEMIRQKG